LLINTYTSTTTENGYKVLVEWTDEEHRVLLWDIYRQKK